jgi:hypothetical protein
MSAPMLNFNGAALKRMLDKHHAVRESCPGCGENVMRTGITHLVYDFGVCSCSEWDYEHLVERIWHRSCVVPPVPGTGDQQ